jgi:hypothetical protein
VIQKCNGISNRSYAQVNGGWILYDIRPDYIDTDRDKTAQAITSTVHSALERVSKQLHTNYVKIIDSLSIDACVRLVVFRHEGGCRADDNVSGVPLGQRVTMSAVRFEPPPPPLKAGSEEAL